MSLQTFAGESTIRRPLEMNSPVVKIHPLYPVSRPEAETSALRVKSKRKKRQKPAIDAEAIRLNKLAGTPPFCYTRKGGWLTDSL